jgi:indolepyruvate ferredoxin oxidoreductase beta subunit
MNTQVKDPYNIIITGVGGQGNVLASQLMGQVLVQAGKNVTIGETYGVTQRGGSVMSHLRISVTEQWSPLIPEGQADMVVGLEPIETLRVMATYGNPETLVATNVRPILPLDVIAGNATYPEVNEVLKALSQLGKKVWTINATEIALEMGNPILANMIMIGAISGLELSGLEIDREMFTEMMAIILSPRKAMVNLDAFDRGRTSIKALTI